MKRSQRSTRARGEPRRSGALDNLSADVQDLLTPESAAQKWVLTDTGTTITASRNHQGTVAYLR